MRPIRGRLGLALAMVWCFFELPLFFLGKREPSGLMEILIIVTGTARGEAC